MFFFLIFLDVRVLFFLNLFLLYLCVYVGFLSV